MGIRDSFFALKMSPQPEGSGIVFFFPEKHTTLMWRTPLDELSPQPFWLKVNLQANAPRKPSFVRLRTPALFLLFVTFWVRSTDNRVVGSTQLVSVARTLFFVVLRARNLWWVEMSRRNGGENGGEILWWVEMGVLVPYSVSLVGKKQNHQVVTFREAADE